MFEQREWVRGADVVSVLRLERDPAGASPSGGARNEDEDVAEEASERVARIPRDGRRDEAVGRAGEQRNLGAGLRAQRVRVAPAPVLVDERTVAQVANA